MTIRTADDDYTPAELAALVRGERLVNRNDIIIRHRFAFAPIFRKALAHHYGREGTVTNGHIWEWLGKEIEDSANHIINNYLDRHQPAE